MAIHHATLKAATAQGFVLSETEDGKVHCSKGSTGVDLHRAADWKAVGPLAVALSEYPLSIVADDDEYVVYGNAGGEGDDRDEGEVIVFQFTPADVNDETVTTILENAESAGVSLESEEEEDEGPSGNIVPSKYKQQYAEMGDPNHCHDWLALRLNEICHVTQPGKKGTFSLERFTAVLEINGVDMGATWAMSRSNGWQGRFRMTGRNILAKRIADEGVMLVPDDFAAQFDGKTELEVPESFQAKYATRAKTRAAKAAVAKPE